MSSFDEYWDSEVDPYVHRDKTIDALSELLSYPFEKKEELGRSIAKYKGAVRVDITRVNRCRVVRSPHKFLTVVSQFAKEASIKPSYGLELRTGNRRDYIHMLLELNETSSVGIFYAFSPSNP
ncbi:MAG: hypothetical protein ACXAD7_10870 [Candidatus Kariarchaeaceae archaeon]